MMRLLRGFGRGLQNGLVAIGALAFLGTVVAVAANYALTQGSGTTFGSVVVGGVNYAQHFICDLTTPSQCAAVSSSGAISTNITAGLNANGSATSANSAPVVIASDQAAVAVKAASASIASGAIASGAVASGAVSSGAIASGAFASGSIGSGAIASGAIASGAVASGAIASGAFAAGSFANATAADPCMFAAKTNLPISQNGTSSVQLVALASSQVINVCSIFLMTNSTATTAAITTGTGTACATGNAAVIGATTANIANSMNLIAGAGFTLGNGSGTIASSAVSGELCLILGANVFVSGNITYVQRVP